jgi:urea carboxylase
MQFPGRRITFPIVLDDHWNKDALARYMSTTRDKAVYLPSNVDYLARNNGLANAGEALQKLIESDWVRRT